MKSTTLKFFIVAILFSALGAYFGMRKMDLSIAPSDSGMARLFTLSLQDTQGQSQALSQWKGKVLVINFWATWCTPCIQEMPELSALQKTLTAKNNSFQLIGIGIDSADNILAFSKKHQDKITYPLYIAGLQGIELLHSLGNQTGGLPFTVLIGRDGQIKKTYLGRVKPKELLLDLNKL